MWRSKRRERAEATVTRLRPISTWLLLLAVVVAFTLPLTVWLYGIAGDDPAHQIEAIKTGLTVAAGTGGFFALLLAFRRQRSTEIIAAETREARDKEYEQRDRAADASERDAEQRRITELYTKAADQLGSEKAPVRLAGLHALERLAQNTPEQRQTIVDVICAYLRMPYTAPEKQPPAEDAPAEARTGYENRRQELQVRLAAQRILAAHLRPDSGDAFWTGINLDLTEAHLYQLDLTNCHTQKVQFGGARFSGNAMFGEAQFGGSAVFTRAQFGEYAVFGEAHFVGHADFNGAQFDGYADFEVVLFEGRADFSEAQFDEIADFGEVVFDQYANFRDAQFGGESMFSRAQFGRTVVFSGTRFRRYVAFVGAQFGGDADFGGDTVSSGAQFDGDTDFGGTCARPGLRHSWPAGWTTRDARTDEGEKEGWMYLVRVEGESEQQPDREDQCGSEAGTLET
ncbi:MAG: pentapeptide repeat-containing protein [Actinomycetota bacterium]|nr:pentapeptide repeat-containing protein [Actinomycetota bacterium]